MAMSPMRLGKKPLVQSIVFPAGVTGIGERARENSDVIGSIVFPPSCTAFGQGLFENCKSLGTISLPAGCLATECAFSSTPGRWRMVRSRVGCTAISNRRFAAVRVRQARLSLRGVRAWEGRGLGVPPEGEHGSCWLWNRRFCVLAVRLAHAGDVRRWLCVTFGAHRVGICAALAFVTLPSKLKSIGDCALGWCTALATMAVPIGQRRVLSEPDRGD
jgi:hypothetical protein